MDILNTREWAILAWLLLVIGYFSFSSKLESLKKTFISLLKTLFSRHILSAIILMSMYVALIIYTLSTIGLWDTTQIKSTTTWYFTIATFSLFRLESYKEAPHRLKDLVVGNLRLIGVIEYLVTTYTFNFFIELILVPVSFVLSAAVAFTEPKPEYKPAHKFLNGMLTITATCILGATFYLLVVDFGKVATTKGVYDFVVPSILSTAYTPFIAFMVVYTTYQTALIRLRLSMKHRPIELYARLVAILVFNIRISLLERWTSIVAKRNIESVSDVNLSIRQIFAMVAREKNPPRVERSEGWSPYVAKSYLVSEGIATGHYHPVNPEEDKEWFCCSNMIEFGQGLFPNNIAYYLNGSANAVTSMKLKLNVNAPEHVKEAHAILLSTASVLVRNALGLELGDALSKAIIMGVEDTIEGPDFKIEITKCIWPNHFFGGYDLGLELSRI